VKFVFKITGANHTTSAFTYIGTTT
jgi:hypothetical protein